MSEREKNEPGAMVIDFKLFEQGEHLFLTEVEREGEQHILFLIVSRDKERGMLIPMNPAQAHAIGITLMEKAWNAEHPEKAEGVAEMSAGIVQ